MNVKCCPVKQYAGLKGNYGSKPYTASLPEPSSPTRPSMTGNHTTGMKSNMVTGGKK